jgi:hypothetical protein
MTASLVVPDWLYGQRVRRFLSRRLGVAAVAVTVVLALGIGAYVVYSRVRPYLHGTDCEADGLRLDLQQAANAATIAAVAIGRELPERALVIAYATAEQESHIRNLPGGDRDSVGLFQQRPSQGWGSKRRLQDPVYASQRFFAALVKVDGYEDRPLHVAAQQVQRSADGTAYAQHEEMAQVLAAAYSGRRPATVRCWFTPERKTKQRRAAALRELRRAFDGRPVRDDAVPVTSARDGWAVASWLVAHAQPYGLTEIRYAGRHWTADDGYDGWTKNDKAPADRVVIK